MENLIYFHIGFHKTATTYLQSILFNNSKNINLINDYKRPWEDPIIRYFVLTPIHLFNDQYIKELVSEKQEFNKTNIISAERLSGHPGSGGFDSFDIAKKIRLTYPNAKIIVNSREYESFKKSCYSQLIKEGYCGKYDDLDSNNWKLPGTSDTYFKQTFIIKHYQKLFGKENVLVQKYEEFLSSRLLFNDKLAQFLRISGFEDLEDNKIINKSLSNAEIKVLRNLNKLRRTEFNRHPIISIKDKNCFRITKLLSMIFRIKNEN